uniref:Uncharacterized protein n=1 Tax=Pseudoalteromonas luteoviolacea TaxID=43657 RepID=A0A023PZX0_9GAMM|nr:hypothetical protein [Pseudoalteromonas luteoviolacea]
MCTVRSAGMRLTGFIAELKSSITYFRTTTVSDVLKRWI